MAVTLEDIAKRAGVTQAAVSEIIRNHPNARRFREETRTRVLKIADELNYRPHFFASQIRAENRKLAMLCVNTLNDFFAAEIAQAFETVMAENGYHLLLSALTNRRHEFYNSIMGPHGLMAMAVIGYSSRLHFPDERLIGLADQGVKIVTVGRRVPSEKISQVYYDNEHAVIGALEHLLDQGAKNIWLFGKRLEIAEKVVDPLGRMDVATEYLGGCQGVTSKLINLGRKSSHDAQAVMAAAIEQDGLPDAIFCETDWLAWGAMKAIENASGRVGFNVAVVGFNDDVFSRYSTPGLSTVQVPTGELGRRAAQELVEIYEGRAPQGRSIEIPTRLIVRESSTLAR